MLKKLPNTRGFRAYTAATKTWMMLITLSAYSQFSQATVVEFRTVLGDVQVNLFDNTTPATVANFLDYVNSGAYVNNVIHRVEPSFVVQGGGFQYDEDALLVTLATGTAVVNEPKLSNLRGTIAMAKQGGNVNSATSQWFFNLTNNSANLDVQNGGFTVFGQVLGDGMDVIDAIADLSRFNLGGAVTSMPLRDYTSTDASNNVSVTIDNIVLISDIVVVDSAASTHPELNPTTNTLINQTDDNNHSNSSGGGAFAWLSVFALMVLFRRWLKKM